MGNFSVCSKVNKPTRLGYLCNINIMTLHLYSNQDRTDQTTADNVFIVDLWGVFCYWYICCKLFCE